MVDDIAIGTTLDHLKALARQRGRHFGRHDGLFKTLTRAQDIFQPQDQKDRDSGKNQQLDNGIGHWSGFPRVYGLAGFHRRGLVPYVMQLM